MRDPRRWLDPLHLATAYAAAPCFEWLWSHRPALAARSAHEITTAAGGAFIRDASVRERLVFLARLLWSDGLRFEAASDVSSPEAPGALVFLGDFLHVGGLGPESLSAGLRRRLAGAGAIVVNLEGVVGDTAHELHPLFTARGLAQLAGWDEETWVSRFTIDDLSAWARDLPNVWFGLANNHAYDDGDAGMRRTRADLEHAGFGAVEEGTVIEVQGRRVGIVALTFGYNHGTPAEAQRFAAVPYAVDPARLRAQRDDLAARGADYFVASLHWGYEHEHRPRGEQHACVDTLWAAGFDGVVGHHPHVVQPIRREGAKWAAFSLGDFLGGDRTIVNRFSIALALDLASDPPRPIVWPLVQTPYFERARTMAVDEAPALERFVWRSVYGARVQERSP